MANTSLVVAIMTALQYQRQGRQLSVLEAYLWLTVYKCLPQSLRLKLPFMPIGHRFVNVVCAARLTIDIKRKGDK